MLIRSIEETVLLRGRKATDNEAIQIPDLEPINWVHPKVGMVPGTPPAAHLLMTGVSGIDVFTPVHHMISRDLGKSWSDLDDPESLGHRWLGRGNIKALADMVPLWHAPTRKLLVIGSQTIYWAGRISPKISHIGSIPYSAMDPDTNVWQPWDELTPPRGFPAVEHIGSGCCQYLVMDNGDILLPVYYLDARESMHRSVAVLQCQFDGTKLKCVSASNSLTHPVKRGLLEPSICHYAGRYLMTIRAEDGLMYYSTSPDGMKWAKHKPWTWTDGEPIATHTTQQHWVTHSKTLFLAYTRKMPSNENVFRFRSPNLLAEVDLDTMTLKRESECVLMRNQGVRLGNHSITHVSEYETWVTDAEWQGNNNDVLLTKIHWNEPNKLASTVYPGVIRPGLNTNAVDESICNDQVMHV